MPVVTLDGAVVQRTNHLKYREIHFHRMLTYGQPVETTAQKCNKGLSVLEATATKGIEQRHLLLLYVTVVFSITDYGPGLTKMAQTNLLKLDRVQNEATIVMLGTTNGTPTETLKFMLDLPLMQIRLRLSGASQSILQ